VGLPAVEAAGQNTYPYCWPRLGMGESMEKETSWRRRYENSLRLAEENENLAPLRFQPSARALIVFHRKKRPASLYPQ